MTVTETAAAAAAVGRRERKKQRTREALIDAAFALFAEKGFEATTVEEIADAVDVSSRTFFRYFASKEDVALTFQAEQHDAVFAALAERPADEPVITALRRAAVSMARACELGELGFDPSRFQCLMDLIRDSPAILAGSLEHAQKKQIALTGALAERMGVDPADDLRPHIAASTAIAAFQAATDVMRCGRLGYRALSEAVDAAFALIEEGLNFPSNAPTGPTDEV
ncbi:TetR family transcriptional regulator [Thermomonospora umbrina]|nr:TetR family transcriptional regulator [Thermomonospora umbrina]